MDVQEGICCLSEMLEVDSTNSSSRTISISFTPGNYFPGFLFERSKTKVSQEEHYNLRQPELFLLSPDVLLLHLTRRGAGQCIWGQTNQ